MIATEEIFKIRDDFIALHMEYKLLSADETNPSVGTSPTDESHDHEEATRKKLSSLVDQMLDIMFRMVVISTNEIEKQRRKMASLQQDHSYSQNIKERSAGDQYGDEMVSDEEEKEAEDEESEEEDDGQDKKQDNEEEEEDCHINEDSTETTLSGNPNDSIESLLTPQVCLNEGDPSSKNQTSSDGCRTDPKSVSDKNDSNQGPQTINIKRKVLIIKLQRSNPLLAGRPVPPLRGFVGKPGRPATQNNAQPPRIPLESNQLKLNELTRRWLDTNRPPPPTSAVHYTLLKLKPEHKQEAYAFYLQYKDLFHRKLIIARIMEKYYLPQKKAAHIIKHGDEGKGFKSGPNGGRKSKLEKDQEKVKEMVAYCKANPFTFSASKLSQKYGIHRRSISRELRKHGIKTFTSAEKRALKLNMEGKEYKPYYDTPELIKYHRTQMSERKKRRKEGDMRDGRSARHKDPTWKSPKELAGVPEGMVVYDKEYYKEWEAKRALLSRSEPEERTATESKIVRDRRKASQPTHEDNDEEYQPFSVELVRKRKQTATNNRPTSKATPTRMSTRSVGRKKKSTPQDTANDESSQSAASDLDTVGLGIHSKSTVAAENRVPGHLSNVWPMTGSEPYTEVGGTAGHSHATRSSTVTSAPQSQAMTAYLNSNPQTQQDYFSQFFQTFNTFEDIS